MRMFGIQSEASRMNYYHMTSLNNLDSIRKKGLIPQSGVNSKLIGDDKIKTFFSEGFEGAIALYVDFQIVYDKIKTGQVKLTDEVMAQKIMKSKSLSDYLGEGVYLRFDGTNIPNERNFENGCTDMTILPENLTVCALQRKSDHSIVFSRFEIIKYMMATVQPEQIQYYGAQYDGAPDFEKATSRIQEKVRLYYEDHQAEIRKYDAEAYQFVLYGLDDFVKEFI